MPLIQYFQAINYVYGTVENQWNALQTVSYTHLIHCEPIEGRWIRRTADHEWTRPVHGRQVTVWARLADRTYTFDVYARTIGLCPHRKYHRLCRWMFIESSSQRGRNHGLYPFCTHMLQGIFCTPPGALVSWLEVNYCYHFIVKTELRGGKMCIRDRLFTLMQS